MKQVNISQVLNVLSSIRDGSYAGVVNSQYITDAMNEVVAAMKDVQSTYETIYEAINRFAASYMTDPMQNGNVNGDLIEDIENVSSLFDDTDEYAVIG